jgi:predicted transcriptional regulator with HTH domain
MKGIQMKTNKIKNFKMSDAVYKLRRKVIELIYEVKKGGVKLPRISVRIGEQTVKHKNVLGCAKMNGNQMWITKDAIDLGIDTLRNVVFHEIAHAVFNINHDEKCPLMQSALNTILNQEDCLKHLAKYQRSI